MKGCRDHDRVRATSHNKSRNYCPAIRAASRSRSSCIRFLFEISVIAGPLRNPGVPSRVQTPARCLKSPQAMRPGRARRISAGKPGLLTQTLTLTLTPGSGSVRSEIRDIGRDFTCSNAVTGFSQKGKNIMAGPVVNTLLTLPQKVFSFRRISLSRQETIRPRPEFQVPGCLNPR